MAQFEQWFSQDLTDKIEIRHCESVMFSGDDKGVVVGVHLFNGGAAYSGGGTVSGKVIRSDGAEVSLTGTISGNDVSVELLESCLAVPGPIGVYIRLTADSQKATVLSAIYTVQATSTGTIVDPGTIITDIDDLIERIDTAIAEIPSDYSALMAAVAPTFSATAQYHTGYYVWYNGELYQYKTNHDAGSWDAAQAVKVPLSKAVGEMQDEARIYQYLTNNGQYTVTADDMENGAWSYSSKVNNTKRIRIANPIPVRAGMQIAYSTPTLRLGFWVLASKTATGSFAQGIGFLAAGSAGTLNITADGYLIIMAESTNNITVADYDCKVEIHTAESCLVGAQYGNNANDLFWGRIIRRTSVMAGITFTWDDDTCTVNGTSTGIAVNILFGATVDLPSDVTPGGKYYVRYKSTNTTDISLRIIFYKADNTAISTLYITGDIKITIPANTAKWNAALYIPSGRTISNAIVSDIRLLTAKTNLELTDEIEGNLFSRYYPEGSTFSVWDMPQNSWWAGPKSYFEESVSIAEKLLTSTTYQILFIGGLVYIINPPSSQFFVGIRRVSDNHQFWSASSLTTKGIIPNNTDFDTLKDIGIHTIQSGYTYINSPDFSGTLLVFPAYGQSLVLQIAISLTGEAKVRTSVGGNFTRPWADISGGGNVYNNTFTFQDYNNTYNITCSPQISTATDNFLPSTGDTTDRTGDIQTMLNTTKVCRLGPGEFYVTGIEIPSYGMLIGSGNSTVLVLDESVTTGYTVKLTNYCCVKSLRIRGTAQSAPVDHPSEVGTRHGIIFESTRHSGSSEGTIYYRSTIENCTIYNFSGGGITLNGTGILISSNLVICDCFVYNCGVGINIPYYSEFHRITNVTAQSCLYGCIDNGGNNNFANCDFSGNEVGLLIDNSAGQSHNNTHASFVGCTFNHSGSNTGTAIRILGGNIGEIFTASQIFYGAIEIEDAVGIRFVGANIGSGVPITISDSQGITFSDSNFRDIMADTNSPISITGSSVVRFENCVFDVAAKHQVTSSGNTATGFYNCYLFSGSPFNPLS